MRRPVRNQSWTRLLIAIAVAIFVAIRGWQEQDSFESPSERQAQQDTSGLEQKTYRVLRVVDGDTLLLEHERTRVRLQGIDTPETVKENTPVQEWGPEASQYTKRFVQDASGTVGIEIDGERTDRHGRMLAFVWHGDRLLNEELVRQGLAKAKLGYDYSQAKKDRLRRAENKARKEQLGIWSK